MSSNEVAIKVRNVGKHYHTFANPPDRLKQMIIPRLMRIVGRTGPSYYRDFTAIHNITFNVYRGETVGIVGRNGCGKSTLLQIICGTLSQTEGSIEVNGRIAALLELGAGFDPEFTGRENVYFNAALLGLQRSDIEMRFGSIASFADIGDFIDQPVKTYSSGMYVRLAFATAINVDPDILVVDEALSVGDEAFQRKCFARIEEIKSRGGTILFVSHNLQSVVQLCDRAILLDRGEKLLEGPPKPVVSQYQRLVNLSAGQADSVREEIRGLDIWKDRASSPITIAADTTSRGDACGQDIGAWYDPSLVSHSTLEYESNGARIRDVAILDLNGTPINVLSSGCRYVYEYFVDFERVIENVGFGMMIKTIDGLELGGAATDFAAPRIIARIAAGQTYRVRFELCWSLSPGTYFTNAGVTGQHNGLHGYIHRVLDAAVFKIAPVTTFATGYVAFDARPQIDKV